MIRLYIGASASGKDFLMTKDATENGYIRLVSYTTRPMRTGEVDGREYHFIPGKNTNAKNRAFLKMAKAGEFMEYRKYNTKENNKSAKWYYGSTPVDNFENLNYVGIVDIQGAKDYIAYYGAENIEIIYVVADADVREKRAIKRECEKNQNHIFDAADWWKQSGKKEEWDRRVQDDAIKFSDCEIDELCRLCGGEITELVNHYESGQVFRCARYAPECAEILTEVAG